METRVNAENFLEKVASFTADRGPNRVTARCFAVGLPAKPRYEILLEGGGEKAILDVPHGVDPHAFLPVAAELFAESLQARH